jgi:beta-carotene 3-hydroxylase
LHEDHHVHHEGKWEKNDIFSALFSLPAVAALVAGYELPEFSFLKPVGFGICAYGILYFVFHDIVVHRRINISFRTQNRYLKRIIRAHRIHHKSNKRNEGEAFGFLYAAKKYEQNDF